MAQIPTYRWGQITVCPRKSDGGRWIVGEIHIILREFDVSKRPLRGYQCLEFPPISCTDEFEDKNQALQGAEAYVQRWLSAKNIEPAGRMKVAACPEADELLH